MFPKYWRKNKKSFSDGQRLVERCVSYNKSGRISQQVMIAVLPFFTEHHIKDKKKVYICTKGSKLKLVQCTS